MKRKIDSDYIFMWLDDNEGWLIAAFAVVFLLLIVLAQWK